MPNDLLSTKVKRCYACVQWEGTRVFNPLTKMVKTDNSSHGNCLVWRTKKLARTNCDKFEPLR